VSEISVSPATLTFTPENWTANQTVTAAGADDNLVDGDIESTLRLSVKGTSTDTSGYLSLSDRMVAIINKDNDTAGLVIGEPSGNTSEAGGQATITARLNSQPSDTVVLFVSSSNTNEVTVSQTALTFTSENWQSNQTVTLAGVNDELADGAQDVVITFSIQDAGTLASEFSAVTAMTKVVSNVDNDTAGLTVTSPTGNLVEGSSATLSFSVRLTSKPNGSVIYTIETSIDDELNYSPGTLLFTAENWNVVQTVSLTSKNDQVADGDVTTRISLVYDDASTDTTGYDSVSSSLDVVTEDNDSARLVVSGVSGNLSDDGGISRVTVRLATQPTTAVNVSISYTDTSEFTVSPSNGLVFTSTNWDQVQTVSFTGKRDDIQDGNIDTPVTFSATAGQGDAYNNVANSSRTLTSIDNDAGPSFIVSSVSGNTSEDGDSATFTIRLSTEPTGDVDFFMSFFDANDNFDTTEGSVDDPVLRFTPTDWNTPQTVTVMGLDDNEVDGNVEYFIVGQDSGSTAAEYANLTFKVKFINEDND
jgi:hypothetical protein